MFTWRAGQFSFEVRDELEARDLELSLPTGINAQYLTMEASRLRDEKGNPSPALSADRALARAREDEEDAPDEDPVFSGEEPSAETRAGRRPRGSRRPRRSTRPREALALATARRVERAARAGCRAAPRRAASAAPASLIVIDPDLQALEWVKSVLTDRFERIHIFQRADAGVSRIRQYLGRAERPLVLLSTRVGGRPALGRRGCRRAGEPTQAAGAADDDPVAQGPRRRDPGRGRHGGRRGRAAPRASPHEPRRLGGAGGRSRVAADAAHAVDAPRLRARQPQRVPRARSAPAPPCSGSSRSARGCAIRPREATCSRW